MCFCAGTKVLDEAPNAIKFLGWLKTFGQTQNIFGPLKRQGIRAYCPNIYSVNQGQQCLKSPQRRHFRNGIQITRCC